MLRIFNDPVLAIISMYSIYRMAHKKEIAALSQKLEESKLEEVKRETVTNRSASQWSNEMAAKEDHLLRMKNNLDWAEGRAERLEVALQQATSELKKRTEMYEKWEFKAGDQQHQISEMEKIRKALTAQIHALRQEIGPKEEKLSLISGKLQEMDREYDMALKAVSDKGQALNQKTASLSMLQKQVRDLRLISTNKDASLRRAAVLFEQYRLTLEAAGAVTVHSHTLSSSLGTRRTSSAGRASLPMKTSLLKRSRGSAACSLNSQEDDVTGMSENIMVFQRLRDVLRPHLITNGNGELNIDVRFKEIIIIIIIASLLHLLYNIVAEHSDRMISHLTRMLFDSLHLSIVRLILTDQTVLLHTWRRRSRLSSFTRM